MKTETSNLKGKNEMKTAQNEVAAREAPGTRSGQKVNWEENPFSTDSRREALMQLAADGDENAAAELFIAYGIDLYPVAL